MSVFIRFIFLDSLFGESEREFLEYLYIHSNFPFMASLEFQLHLFVLTWFELLSSTAFFCHCTIATVFPPHPQLLHQGLEQAYFLLVKYPQPSWDHCPQVLLVWMGPSY